ncbi:MAG: hypothetical protein ACOCV8_04065 [Spirochaetota bacterium]
MKGKILLVISIILLLLVPLTAYSQDYTRVINTYGLGLSITPNIINTGSIFGNSYLGSSELDYDNSLSLNYGMTEFMPFNSWVFNAGLITLCAGTSMACAGILIGFDGCDVHGLLIAYVGLTFSFIGFAIVVIGLILPGGKNTAMFNESFYISTNVDDKGLNLSLNLHF